MKKIFTLSFLCLALFNMHAQGIEISVKGTSPDISGTEHICSNASPDATYYFDVKNTTGSSLNLKIKRIRIIEASGSSNDICWGIGMDGSCYSDTTDGYITPFITIPSADMGEFKPIYHHGGNSSTSKFRYYVVNSETEVSLDSVDLIFTSTLSLEKNNNIVLYVFPNPVSDYLTIHAKKINGNITISIFDLVGKEVAKTTLISGKNQLDLSDLRTGIYFYSIIRDNDIIETKKLIVK